MEYQIKNIFIEKSCRKYAAKASPRPLYNFGKQPKTAIACKKFFEKQNISKEDYQKALKRVTLFFLSNPVPFNGQNYQKHKGSGTSDQSLFRLRYKLKDSFWT